MNQLIETISTASKKALAAGVLVAALLAGSLLAAPPAHASTTFTVNNITDEGDGNLGNGICDLELRAFQCTLRAAIEEANFEPGADTITFNVPETFRDPSSGVATIKPQSALPQITDAVTLDGYTQPGASPNTLTKGTNAALKIELNGFEAEPASGLSIASSDVVLRGLVINRFANQGIDTSGAGTTNFRIEGNFIGTDPSGTIDLGNGGDGVEVARSSNSTVGGFAPDKRNLISGNDVDGISIVGTQGDRVLGNLIGTKKDGVGALGNGFNGVDVSGSSGTSILRNSIFSNGALGIDLGTDGRTPNDLGDADIGANSLQNFPVITSAKTASGSTTIGGKLNSIANKSYTLQFFSNPSGDEGKKFIGQKRVSTDASGDVTFTFKPKKKVGVGQKITATVTRDFTGDTSEFSAARKVVAA